ncbi:MAG: pyroglutamyl-peptidase I [Psychrobacillus sp.]
MKRLLLTGFEPFLELPVNPTMKIVEELNGLEINGYKIIGRILTVDFRSSGDELLQLLKAEKPDAHISLGLAAGRYKITPERIAINIQDGEVDNQGNKPIDEVIHVDGQPAYFSTLPIRRMVEKLIQSGFPAEISNTAGTYLCNHVMYKALHYANMTKNPMKSGFIHIPACHELAIAHGKIPSWSHEDLKNSIITCIGVLDHHEN